jgi:hypothetical protein
MVLGDDIIVSELDEIEVDVVLDEVLDELDEVLDELDEVLDELDGLNVWLSGFDEINLFNSVVFPSSGPLLWRR